MKCNSPLNGTYVLCYMSFSKLLPRFMEGTNNKGLGSASLEVYFHIEFQWMTNYRTGLPPTVWNNQ